jgi:iron complex transport system ATP-binding protein
LLRAADLSFHYGPAFVLEDLSLDVSRGSFVGVLGPNGCGKTTLLKLMAGVIVPATGGLTLNGVPLRQLSRRQIAQQVSIVPQETHPAFDYSVQEIVLMGRHPHLGRFAVEGPADVAVAHDAMVATGTVHLGARSYMTLSGGEKQRVIIASALAQAPNLLLLDEPTASLDLGYQLAIAALLRELNQERGVTLVLATHDLNLAASVCDSLVLLRQGRVLAQGPTVDVLTPSLVRQLYDVEADVSFHSGAGHLTVTPLRRDEATR